MCMCAHVVCTCVDRSTPIPSTIPTHNQTQKHNQTQREQKEVTYPAPSRTAAGPSRDGGFGATAAARDFRCVA